MINLDMSTMIHRPVKQVFDFMSAPENDFQWQYGTLASARISGGVNDMGTFFRSIGHLMGHRNVSTFAVMAYERNKQYGFRTRSGPLRSQTSYTFEFASSSTRVTISMQADVINFRQVEEELLEKTMKVQLKENLEMLKNLLETQGLLPVPEAL